MIKTWEERCVEHPDHQTGMVSYAMIQARMQEEIDELRDALKQRKPLTDDEIELAYREIWRDLSDGFSHTSVEWIEAGIRYAEKVHGIANEP